MRNKLKVKCIWISASLIFGSIQIVGAQTDLSLSECLEKVKAATAESEQIALTQQMSDLQNKVTSRNYWPQLNLGGKATWQSDVTSLPIEIPNFDVPTVPKDQYSATIDVNQVIYDGGVTKAIQNMQKAESTLKVNQLESGLLDAEKQAIDLFFQIAMQQNLRESTNLLKTQLEVSSEQSEKLLKAGIIDKKDWLSIQVKLLEVNQKLKESDYYKAAAKKSLANLMLQPDTAFEVVFSQAGSQIANSSFASRPEIQALEARSQLLSAQNNLNDAKVRPLIASFINAGYGRPGLNFLANSFDWYALAGVKLTIPIDHFYTRKKEMQNQINQLEIRSSDLAKGDLLRRFSRVEIQYRDEIDKLNDWLEEDEQIIDLRTQMQAVSEAKWKSGVITTTEYLSEVTELNVAQERLATHQTMLAKVEALLKNLYAIK